MFNFFAEENNMKWKIGTSKVNKFEVKDTIAMPGNMADHGLTAYQITLPKQMNLSDKSIEAVLKNAREQQITLSFHAENGTIAITNENGYKALYEKYWANTFEYCAKLNAPSVLHIHGGYWKDRNQQLEILADRISRITSEYEFNPNFLYLESAGKKSEFGADFLELFYLTHATNTRICVDFAHLQAVYQERFNETLVKKILRLLESTTWKYEQYFHISGIEFNDKGEVKHLPLEESSLNWQMVLDCIKESDLAGRIITESGYENCHDAKLIRDYLLQ